MEKVIGVGFKGFIIIVCIFMPLFLQAQFHDTLQRSILKSMGIHRIEKLERDSGNVHLKNKLVSVEAINREGFIVKTINYGDSGDITSRYEHHYLGDTLLIKSHLYQDNPPSEQENVTEYSYNRSNQLEEIRFYNGGKLVSSVVYVYSKDGRIEKQKQAWYGDKSKGSHSGRGLRTFKHNERMLVEEMVTTNRMKGKKEKETHRYSYDDKGNHVETIVFDKRHPKGFRMKKKVYDEMNRLVVEATFFRSDTKMHIGGKEISILAGEQLDRGVSYNAQGLKDEEWQSVNGKRFQEVKYVYSE